MAKDPRPDRAEEQFSRKTLTDFQLIGVCAADGMRQRIAS
jgi:hypothetical protein